MLSALNVVEQERKEERCKFVKIAREEGWSIEQWEEEWVDFQCKFRSIVMFVEAEEK